MFDVAILEFLSIWRQIWWSHSLRSSRGSIGVTFRSESSCRDSTWHRPCLSLYRLTSSIRCAGREGFQVVRQLACSSGRWHPLSFFLIPLLELICIHARYRFHFSFQWLPGSDSYYCVSNSVEQGDAFETCVLFSPLSPRFAQCLRVILLAQRLPSAMTSLSSHRLQKVLLLLLSSKRYSSRLLILTCPNSITCFQVIESTTTIMHALFSKMLCRPILSSHDDDYFYYNKK